MAVTAQSVAELHAADVHTHCIPDDCYVTYRLAWLWSLHRSGVHVHCTAGDCERPGTVERFHAHDYDGPLLCCPGDG